MTDETKPSWPERVLIAAVALYSFGVFVTMFVLAFLQGLGPDSSGTIVVSTLVYAFFWPVLLFYWLTGTEIHPYVHLVVNLIVVALALSFWLALLFLAYRAIRVWLDKRGGLGSVASRWATEARSKPTRTLRRTAIVLGWSAIATLLVTASFAETWPERSAVAGLAVGAGLLWLLDWTVKIWPKD